ncbi:MAG: hypothetical protein WC385_00100 [Candidatus Paceibacterota bacterium]|jgi:hypothetical protein
MIKTLKKFYVWFHQTIIKLAGLRLTNKDQFADLLTQNKSLINFYENICQEPAQKRRPGVSCLIFSMDRAMQLHALLSSLLEKFDFPPTISVLYRATSPAQQRSYQEVETIFSDQKITFIDQEARENFYPQLLKLIEKIETEKIFFLVDDLLFIEDIRLDDLLAVDSQKFILSLRMGQNLKKSYTGRAEQPLPKFYPNESPDSEKICWHWNEGQFNWRYPLSVDGHLFLTKEILAMFKCFDFNSPNTLEANWQIFWPLFSRRLGLAYKKSKILNIPCNKVQTDNNNEFGNWHQDDLLTKWNEGRQIDYRSLYGFINESAHQEIELKFIKRK